MTIRQLGIAIGAGALVLAGLTAAPAEAEKPVPPAIIGGCYGGVLEGHRAWYRCGGPDIRPVANRFRTWAACVGGETVRGPWKAVTYAQSIAPGCSRGIQNGGKRYSYDLAK